MKALNLLLSSKGYPVKDKAAALIGMKMKGGAGWPITTLTGSLPLTYESRTEHILKNYVLYGSASGAGEATENIATPLIEWGDGYVTSDGWINTPSTVLKEKYSDFIAVLPSTAYRCEYQTGNFPAGNIGAWVGIGYYDNNKTFISRVTSSSGSALIFSTPKNTGYLRVSFRTYGKPYNVMLTPRSTAPSSYVPYGYKIPLTNSGENSQSETYPIYIGSSKLGAEEYLDYETGKIYKMIDGVLTPTDPPAPFPAITAYAGENTLSSTETVGTVTVTGRIKETET